MANEAARQALVESLNEDLAHEYQAVLSYLLYSRMVHGQNRPELSSFLEGEISDELGHAKLLAHKVVAFGGTPATQPAEVVLGNTNREMLQLALQAEKDTIDRYTQRIKQADAAGEIGLRVDLEDIVAEETRHKEDLERLLLGWTE